MSRPARVRPAGWWFDVLLLAAFVALTVALADGRLLGLDRAVADWSAAHRPAPAHWVALGLNLLGQGTPLTLIAAGLAVLLGRRTGSVRPLLPVAAAFLVTGLTVKPLKLWTDRAAPSASVKEPHLPEADAVQLFHTPGTYGQSYPSGHVANAIVWYAVLALLLAALLRTLGRDVPHRWIIGLRVVPPLVVLGTTTYLSFHWLTDSVAGLLLGLLLYRLLYRVPWDDLPLPAPARRFDRPASLTSAP